MSINLVTLIGRVARDPERREMPNGTIVAEFSIAVDKRKTKMSENPEPNWFRVSCFDRQADYVLEYIGKGRLVAITGRLDHRKYQDRDGNNRETISIIADNVQGLDRPREDEGQKGKGTARTTRTKADDIDDDPFN